MFGLQYCCIHKLRFNEITLISTSAICVSTPRRTLGDPSFSPAFLANAGDQVHAHAAEELHITSPSRHTPAWNSLDRHTGRRVLLPKIFSVYSMEIFIGESGQRHSRSSTPACEMRLLMQVRRKCRAHKTLRRSFCRPASHSLEIDAQFRCNVKACSPGMSSSLRVVQSLRDIGRMTKNGHILRHSWT
ncbi:hypothetical protein B5807_09487 [Epicoccum nigrum]|uniref:Uncharacterized protein n=1 Tax=Epicoccum nigrum TaxID=105696 RepID=A0A1Y2LNU9_EPING|nr:hypothetical protein B5807_09487 [Epicoccum nigrum]